MKFVLAVALLGLSVVAQGQRQQQQQLQQPTTTPVPILRQINKVNEDGSYTYGYENADGSYKIETKDTSGQVQGKYGYYDDIGELREVEYGASRAGFYPQGTGIKAPVVAPPRNDIDAPTDGSYDPNLYTYPYQYDNVAAQQGDAIAPQAPQAPRRRVKSGRRQQNSASRSLDIFNQFQPQPTAAPQYQQPQPQQQYQQPQYQQQYQQSQYQQQQYQQQQYQQPQPQPQQRQYYQPQPQAPAVNPANLFQGHPARNIDINTGSYSVSYAG